MTHKQNTPTRRRFIVATGTFGLATLGASGAATATTNTDEFAGVFGADFDVEVDNWALIRGYFSRLQNLGPPSSSDTLADRARNEFDSNQDAWLSYGNWLLDEHGASPVETATIAVNFQLTRRHWPTRNERTETTLAITLDSAGEVVDEVDWRSETASDSDYQVTLRNDAAIVAADELQRFRRRWIDEEGDDHKLPDDEYLSELAGRHAPDILLGGTDQNVLELLLGEVRI